MNYSHSAARTSLPAAVGNVIRILDVAGEPLTYSVMAELIHRSGDQHRICAVAQVDSGSRSQMLCPIAARKVKVIRRSPTRTRSHASTGLRPREVKAIFGSQRAAATFGAGAEPHQKARSRLDQTWRRLSHK